MNAQTIAFSIDFESYTEAMEESFDIPRHFPRFEVEDELRANTERCLELLAEHRVRATFFVLGWIAERFPDIVRRLAEAGHEIGSHSFHHRRLRSLGGELAPAVRRAKAALEDATGGPVVGFRAPDFSLPDDDRLFDLLAELGFRYDSSINPTTVHDVYGRAGAPRRIYRLENGLTEFPPSTVQLTRRFVLTVGGGGYLRLFPWWFTRWGLRQNADAMAYLHPYEIGGHFPRGVPMTTLRRLRHNYRNGRLDHRLRRLFTTFDAIPIVDYLERHDAAA